LPTSRGVHLARCKVAVHKRHYRFWKKQINAAEPMTPSIRQLITYAELSLRMDWRRADTPNGWALERIWRHWLTGLTAGVFHCHNSGETVIAIRGVRPWDLRNVVSALVRRRFGYSKTSLRFAQSIQRQDTRIVTIIGHSGGGGLASWLGYKLDVPTVTFNSGRTRSSLLNDGHRQFNVCVRGDFWGDPWNGLYSMPLRGEYLVLDRSMGSRQTHSLVAIIQALKERLPGDR